jgi:ribosomal-protein-alanine N-acetyltransferase
MPKTVIYSPVNKPNPQQKQELVEFLDENLEQYGDAPQDIEKAIDYALKNFTSFGGFTMLLKEQDTILAAVVINQTGMGGYIPENILVYIATSKKHRGQGLGKKLMTEVIAHANGDIALHVEANNPAKKLYEKFGFTNPYLEMRLKK